LDHNSTTFDIFCEWFDFILEFTVVNIVQYLVSIVSGGDEYIFTESMHLKPRYAINIGEDYLRGILNEFRDARAHDVVRHNNL